MGALHYELARLRLARFAAWHRRQHCSTGPWTPGAKLTTDKTANNARGR